MGNGHQWFESKDGITRCFAPIEMLFCEDLRFNRRDDALLARIEKCHVHAAGRSILSLRSHVRMFRGFLDSTSTPDFEAFVHWWNGQFTALGEPAPCSAKERLAERHEYFVLLCQTLHSEGELSDALTLNCRFDVATNRILLNDGHHRAAFLLASGRRWVCVRMPEADFADWFDIRKAITLRRELTRPGLETFYQPVEHPLAPSRLTHRDNHLPNRLGMIADALGYIKPKSVLDLGCNIGYFARHFAREGARVVGVEPQDPYVQGALALNRFTGLDWQCIQGTAEGADLQGEVFEIGLALTLLYHFLDKGGIAAAMAKKLDRHVSNYVFWESGDDPAREIAFMAAHTGFRHYHRLGHTLGTRKHRDLGVFARDEGSIQRLIHQNPFSVSPPR